MHTHLRPLHLRSLLAATVAFCATASALAQSDLGDAADDNPLEEVIVTGQKIERSLQDTQDSVQVFSETFIEEQRLWELKDVYLQTANAFDLNNGEAFGIRGVSQGAQSTGGGDGELGVLYIDGVAYLGFASRFGPKQLWDVEQVEVLRGPQSTNVGRNALIGAVVVSTKQPVLGEYEAAGRAEIGNFDTYGLEGMLNLPLGETVALRFTAEGRNTDGFITNRIFDDDEWDAREHRVGRGRLLWAPSDRLRISFMAQYAETARGQEVYRADLIENIEDRISSDNVVGFEDYEGTSGALDIEYVISERVSFRSLTSFLDSEYARQDDDDGSPEGGQARRGRNAEDDNWAQEFRFDIALGDVGGTAGLYYTEIDRVNDTLGLVNINPSQVGVPDALLPFYPPLLEVDVFSPFVGSTENTALFTEWYWDVNADWRLTAGLRYDDESETTQSNTFNTLAEGSELPDPVEAGMLAEMLQPGLGPIVEAGVAQVNAALQNFLLPSDNPPIDASYDAWLPKFGVVRNLGDDRSLGLLYSRGYRAGGVDISLANQRSDFEPEYLDNFELAWRSVLLDGDMVLNANAYYGDWSDQQVAECPQGPLSCVTVNAGESEIYGAELEINHVLTDDLSWFTSLGYAHTEFTEFVSDIDGDLSGNSFAFSPEFSAAVGGNWWFADRWAVSGNVTYQDEFFGDVANTIVIDDRTLLNANLRYEADHFSVVAYARNLTDEFYLTGDFPGAQPGSRYVTAGPPREFGVLLRVETP